MWQILSQLSVGMIGLSLFAYLVAVIVIVFFHELGHFMVGRWCGVGVDSFSVGFGREVFGFYDRHGTRWKFSALPLGGYVKFAGDANAAGLPTAGETPASNGLQSAFLWKRFLIVAAGPVANFILAIFIFAAAFMVLGQNYHEPKVGSIVPGSAAERAKLMAGDVVRKIDGQTVSSFEEISNIMLFKPAVEMSVVIERAGETFDVTVHPTLENRTDALGDTLRVAQIGIGPDTSAGAIKVMKFGPVAAFGQAASDTWSIISTTIRFLGKIITGHQNANALHGPGGTAYLAGKVASLGLWPFITFIGFISVSIGLVNLFPIPMLDGGHLVFFLLEGIMGKPVSPQAQEWSFRIGLSAILMLMIFVSTNDVFLLLKH